jgi:hypothetical protein
MGRTRRSLPPLTIFVDRAHRERSFAALLASNDLVVAELRDLIAKGPLILQPTLPSLLRG